jgi:hypothetical protein
VESPILATVEAGERARVGKNGLLFKEKQNGSADTLPEPRFVNRDDLLAQLDVAQGVLT